MRGKSLRLFIRGKIIPVITAMNEEGILAMKVVKVLFMAMNFLTSSKENCSNTHAL